MRLLLFIILCEMCVHCNIIKSAIAKRTTQLDSNEDCIHPLNCCTCATIDRQDFSFGGLGDKTHSTEFSCAKSEGEWPYLILI